MALSTQYDTGSVISLETDTCINYMASDETPIGEFTGQNTQSRQYQIDFGDAMRA